MSKNEISHKLQAAHEKLYKAAPLMLDTLKWLKGTIHQAHHDGLQEKCIRHTCDAIRRAIYEAEGS